MKRSKPHGQALHSGTRRQKQAAPAAIPLPGKETHTNCKQCGTPILHEHFQRHAAQCHGRYG